MNMHSLVHLSKLVRTWEPLWSYSCFGFKSMNGHLRRNCHGTRLVLSQLIHNVRLQQLLPSACKKIISGAAPSIAAFIESVTKPSNDTTHTTEAVVRITHKLINENIASALLHVSAGYIQEVNTTPTLPLCERIRHNSVQYSTAARDGQQRARDGSTCIFKHQTRLQFGSIAQFCFVKKELVAVVRIFEVVHRGILDDIHAPSLTSFDLGLCSTVNSFVFLC